MSTPTKNDSPTKVVTGKVRFSYASVFEPKAMSEGETPKYSCAILIPKTDTATVKKIEAAIKAAVEAGKSKLEDKKGNIVMSSLKLPLRDGDAEKPDDENYEGMYFLNANSLTKPTIVDKDVQPIMDRDDFYSGCWGHASLSFYAFAGKSKGIAVGLNHLMKTADGERLGGGSTAAEDFAEIAGLADDDLL